MEHFHTSILRNIRSMTRACKMVSKFFFKKVQGATIIYRSTEDQYFLHVSLTKISSSKGPNETSRVSNCPTMYLMLFLLGGIDITDAFLIPRVFITYLRNELDTVAVSAMRFTFDGMMLQSSPILANSRRNSSPLHGKIRFV